MPIAMTSRTARTLGLALGAAGLVAVAAPAMAQAYYTVPEVVVTPERLGPDGRPMTLSQVVNISDLDLRYDRDVRMMRERIRSTARHLCDELGESDTLPSVGRSCVNDAVRSAEGQARYAIAQARSSSYYAYATPVVPVVPPYAGYYAPPAAAVVPDPDYVPPTYVPPDL